MRVACQDDTGPIIAVFHIPCIITNTIRFDVLQGTGLALRNTRFYVGGCRQSNGKQEAGD